MLPNEEPLISSDRIAQRIEELARAISKDFAGEEVVLVVVLKGGVIFASDLARRLSVPVVLEFVRAKSYVDRNRRAWWNSPAAGSIASRPACGDRGGYLGYRPDLSRPSGKAAGRWGGPAGALCVVG